MNSNSYFGSGSAFELIYICEVEICLENELYEQQRSYECGKAISSHSLLTFITQ